MINRQLAVIAMGLGIIVVSNAAALLGVSYNRTGEPESQLALTERELIMPFQYRMNRENSGMALTLKWRASYEQQYTSWQNITWLDRTKLVTLGFELPEISGNKPHRLMHRDRLSREAFIVLEYNDTQYQQALRYWQDKLLEEQSLLQNSPDNSEFIKRVKRAQEALDAEKTSNTRLFAIDVGSSIEKLRDSYADRSQYLILKGRVRVSIEKVEGEYQYNGRISNLLTDKVNVPLQLRPIFDALEDNVRNKKQPPRYSAMLSTGQRLEPWIEDVKAL